MAVRRADDRLNKVFVFALIIALSLGLVAMAYAAARLYARSDDTPIPLNCSSIDNLQTDSDAVYFYMDGTLYCYGDDGGLRWQYALGDGADYRVYDAGVAAWQGNKLFIIARDGRMLYTGTLTTVVDSCAICASYVAIETVVNGSRALQVIEYNGRTIDTLDMSALTLLDYGFFNDSSMLWVLTLNTEGTVPLTQVDTYQPARFQTGSIPDTTQILYKVVLDNNDLTLIGTNTLRRYTYSGREQGDSSRLIYGWYYLDSYVSGSRSTYLFAPSREFTDGVSIKNMRVIGSDMDYTCHFQTACMGVHAGQNAAWALSNQYAFKNTYGSKTVEAYRLPLYVDQVVAFTDSGAAVVVSQQRVYIIKLP